MTTENYNRLLDAATKYYNGEDTGLTDEEYDKLYFEAKADIKDFNIFKLITIGSDPVDVEHHYPFTPQEFKIQFRSIEEIKAYIDSPENKGWTVTCKWDGCSIRAYYKNGNLYDILTRSDEYVGKRKINSLYNKVPKVVDPRVIAIDFEALCSREDYGDEPRSNANGLVNSKYKQVELDKYLTLIPFKVTTKENMNYLDAMRLVFKDGDFSIINTVDTLDYNNRFVEYKGKHYPIDGVVLYDDTTKSHRIYKHYFKTIPVTTVENIEWNFQETLCWVPKIILKPIELDGRTCRRTSSNGYANLKYLRAGKGAEVEVILANSTIPQIHSVLTPSDDYCEPKTCSYCGAEVINVDENLRCSNQFCPNVIDWIMYKYSSQVDEYVKMASKEDIKNYFESIKGRFTQDQLLTYLAHSLIIPRFSKLDQVSELFISNKDKLFEGSKSIDLLYSITTWNQYHVYETYQDLIDYIIQVIKEY